jgi:hypothetical protein
MKETSTFSIIALMVIFFGIFILVCIVSPVGSSLPLVAGVITAIVELAGVLLLIRKYIFQQR